MVIEICIMEKDKGYVDLTFNHEQAEGQPMKILNLPEDYIGSMLQKYYELVKEAKV